MPWLCGQDGITHDLCDLIICGVVLEISVIFISGCSDMIFARTSTLKCMNAFFGLFSFGLLLAVWLAFWPDVSVVTARENKMDDLISDTAFEAKSWHPSTCSTSRLHQDRPQARKPQRKHNSISPDPSEESNSHACKQKSGMSCNCEKKYRPRKLTANPRGWDTVQTQSLFPVWSCAVYYTGSPKKLSDLTKTTHNLWTLFCMVSTCLHCL